MNGFDFDLLLRNAPAALLLNLGFGILALRAGSVRRSGFAGGLAVGIPIALCLGWRGFAVLLAMFAIGTALTRFGYARKEALGAAEERGGARGASHAFANAGVPALAALGAWAVPDPLWTVGFTAAFATASMDTAGSEIGPLFGKRTISLRDLRPVAPGTEGAVSLEGTLAGLGAAAGVGLVAAAVGLVPPTALAAILLGAATGNLYEGILGSRGLLPHAWLNATNTLVGALVAAAVAALLLRS